MNRPILLLLLIAACVISPRSFAQSVLPAGIPIEFTSEEDNRLIKENDSLKYYVASHDTTNTVCLDEEANYYKLLNKDHKLVAEGAFVLEGEKYLQVGKWNEHYPGGKVKLTGYYEKGKPVGTWQEYYSTGKIKTICNYAFIDDKGARTSCVSGTYQEYYQSGKLKVNGIYCAVSVTIHDTVTVADPVENTETQRVITHKTYNPEKTGHWEYYTESGEIEKKEDL